MLQRIVETSGAALLFPAAEPPRSGAGRYMLERMSAAKAAACRCGPQVATRPVGVLFGLELTAKPFSTYPTYREIAKAPFAERVARLRDPTSPPAAGRRADSGRAPACRRRAPGSGYSP